MLLESSAPTNEEDTRVTTTQSESGTVTQAFDFSPISFHQWEQRGPEIICLSCPHRHGSSIPPGTVLTRNQKGKFELISEEEDMKRRAQ